MRKDNIKCLASAKKMELGDGLRRWKIVRGDVKICVSTASCCTNNMDLCWFYRKNGRSPPVRIARFTAFVKFFLYSESRKSQ